MLKRLCLLVFTICLFLISNAQDVTIDTIPAYQKTNKLPQANLLAMDGSWYNLYNKNSAKPTVIIVYNPGCHHCELEAEEFAKNLEALKHIDFLWVTTNGNKEESAAFAKKFGLDKQQNFRFLYDPNYKLAIFYEVKTTPFTAVYDATGKMKKIFRQSAQSAGILQALK